MPPGTSMKGTLLPKDCSLNAQWPFPSKVLPLLLGALAILAIKPGTSAPFRLFPLNLLTFVRSSALVIPPL
jgi:hypothetical protein